MVEKKSKMHVSNQRSHVQQEETTKGIDVDKLNQLPDELLKDMGGQWLEPHDAQRIQKEARGQLHQRKEKDAPPLQLFDPIIKAIAPDYAVLTGQPEKLLHYLNKDPALFFKKIHQITGPGGLVYYDVSPVDLILFLGDYDMQNQVHAWATEHFPEGTGMCREEFFEKWKAHQASRGQGGADIVVVSGNELPNYASICKVTDTFGIYGMTAERNLLTNPNGIVCWKDANEQLRWYYADSKTKTLESIEIPEALLAAHQKEYDVFVSRIKNMEPNTAKRSSDDEHRLIKNLMQYTKTERGTKTKVPVDLVREGIRYRQQDGSEYRDTQYDVNRVLNAYLKCIRLYRLAGAETDSQQKVKLQNNADNAWCTEVGYEQRGVPLNFFQRICTSDGSLWLLTNHYKETFFVRDLKILNYKTNRMVLVFDVQSGQFAKGFGEDDVNSGFAIWVESGMCVQRGGHYRSRADLIIVNRLVTDAYSEVNVFEPQVPRVGLSGSHD